MFSFAWADEASDDLDHVLQVDPSEVEVISEFYDLCAGKGGDEPNQQIALALTLSEFRRIEDPAFDTRPVVRALHAGLNIYRACLTLPSGRKSAYRIIYGVDHTPGDNRIVFLGLMPRSVNYDPDHHLWQRMVRSYWEFQIPGLLRT